MRVYYPLGYQFAAAIGIGVGIGLLASSEISWGAALFGFGIFNALSFFGEIVSPKKN